MKQYDDPRVPDVYGEAELKRMIAEIKASQDALREDRQRLLEENDKLKYKIAKDAEYIAKLEAQVATVTAGSEEMEKLYSGTYAAILRSIKATKRYPVRVDPQHLASGIKGVFRPVSVMRGGKWQMWYEYVGKTEQGEE